MTYNPDKHHRRSIRLEGYDYSQAGWYFVTICVNNHECLFGYINNGQFLPYKFGNIIADCWFQIRNKYQNIKLDELIIMPNHIHGIIQTVGAIHELPLQPIQSNNPLSRRKMLLPKIIGYFKMNSAKQINKLRRLTGIHVWQRNYYDHIIHNEDELNRIRYYIKNNPINWKDDNYHV